jgi:hypothetical protein
MDVAHANAAELGRALARCRWGSRGVDNAIGTLQQRQDELSEAHLVQLRQLADTQPAERQGSS